MQGGAFGNGLSNNIQDAYRFLAHNYVDGDQVYLFGFSRGAYTARSLAGMISQCGLLQKESLEYFPDLYGYYRADDEEKKCTKYRKIRHKNFTHRPHVRVNMIGVWDTVGALGIPLTGLRLLTRGRYEFHETNLNGYIDNAFQALAIDESRGPFIPCLWRKPENGHSVNVEQVWFAGSHSPRQ